MKQRFFPLRLAHRMACLAAMCLAFAPFAEAKKSAKPKPQGFVLARHLEMAVEIDAQSRALEAQRRAVGARYATSNSITPGSPYIAGAHRSYAAGNLHEARRIRN